MLRWKGSGGQATLYMYCSMSNGLFAGDGKACRWDNTLTSKHEIFNREDRQEWANSESWYCVAAYDRQSSLPLWGSYLGHTEMLLSENRLSISSMQVRIIKEKARNVQSNKSIHVILRFITVQVKERLSILVV